LFEHSSIPLDDTFGSSSDITGRNQSVILLIGPRVECSHLVEILDLLAEASLPVHFIMATDETDRRKTIYIGAYNLDHEQVAPFTHELESLIRSLKLDADELSRVIRSLSTVTPITAR
jgi:hypothetical protein